MGDDSQDDMFSGFPWSQNTLSSKALEYLHYGRGWTGEWIILIDSLLYVIAQYLCILMQDMKLIISVLCVCALCAIL